MWWNVQVLGKRWSREGTNLVNSGDGDELEGSIGTHTTTVGRWPSALYMHRLSFQHFDCCHISCESQKMEVVWVNKWSFLVILLEPIRTWAIYSRYKSRLSGLHLSCFRPSMVDVTVDAAHRCSCGLLQLGCEARRKLRRIDYYPTIQPCAELHTEPTTDPVCPRWGGGGVLDPFHCRSSPDPTLSSPAVVWPLDQIWQQCVLNQVTKWMGFV